MPKETFSDNSLKRSEGTFSLIGVASTDQSAAVTSRNSMKVTIRIKHQPEGAC